MNVNYQEIKRNLNTIFLCLCLFGYIFVYFSPFNNQVFSNIINFLIRSMIILLSFFIIYIYRVRLRHVRKPIIFFYFFYFFYLFKSYLSFSNNYFDPNITNELSKKFLYFSIFVIPIPVLALIVLDYSKVNFQHFVKTVFWILFFLLLFNFTFVVFFTNDFDKTSGIFRSYYILVGHYGLSLIVVCLFNFFCYHRFSYLDIVGIFLGGFTIFISAARSPILALYIILIILIYKLKKKIYWFVFIFISLVLLVLVYLIGKDMIHFPNSFFIRLYKAIFEFNGSGRSFYIKKGILNFIENPIFGNNVLNKDGTYSHNIFFDILATTGIFGAILFLFYYKFVVQSFFNILSSIESYKEVGVLVLFFLQYFILSQTSGCVYLSFEHWYFGATLIGLNYSYKKNNK